MVGLSVRLFSRETQGNAERKGCAHEGNTGLILNFCVITASVLFSLELPVEKLQIPFFLVIACSIQGFTDTKKYLSIAH